MYGTFSSAATVLPYSCSPARRCGCGGPRRSPWYDALDAQAAAVQPLDAGDELLVVGTGHKRPDGLRPLGLSKEVAYVWVVKILEIVS